MIAFYVGTYATGQQAVPVIITTSHPIGSFATGQRTR